MKKYSKNDIIDSVVSRTGENRELVSKLVNETLTAIRARLSSGESEVKVSLYDFGTFEVHRTKPRSARNPRTNEPVKVPARRRVVFLPGKYLKSVLKATYEE